MDYSKIIAVSGLPGLHELVSSKNDGAIVRSLDDKSTRFVSSRIHNFSHLESIEIYTVRDNVNLVEILLAMEKSSKAIPDVKDTAAVKKYFEDVFPHLDFERVYASDMKKIVKWFEVLKSNSIEIKLTEPEPEEEVTAPVIEKPAAKKAAPAAKEEPKKKAAQEIKEEPKAKAKAKTKEVEKEAPKKTTKAAAPKATKTKKEEKEDAPKKKAAPKKK
jgi:Domain of unknown function (DUF5606)